MREDWLKNLIGILRMPVIQNTWVEKQKKKKSHDTAPAYASDHIAASDIISSKKPKKRFSLPSCGTLVKTLRGVRK